MMKPALFTLLCICVGVSVANAQIVPIVTKPLRAAPEIDWTVAGPALILLSGAVAILRGRRRH